MLEVDEQASALDWRWGDALTCRCAAIEQPELARLQPGFRHPPACDLYPYRLVP